MMNEILNHKNNEQVEFNLRDHLKCGEVYTWLCAGELYAIECKLCEDHPLCPLSEFPQHMEIWHTDWQDQSLEQTRQQQQDFYSTENEDQEENHYDFYTLSNTNEDSGLFEAGDQLQHNRVTQEQLLPNDSALEPFEQVLIQQDNVIESTQLKEDGEEAEQNKLKDVNKQVAKEEKAAKGVKHHDQLKFNVNNNLTLGKHKQTEITEDERDFAESETTITESENDLMKIQENERLLQAITESRNVKTENEMKLKEFLKNQQSFNKNKINNKKFIKQNLNKEFSETHGMRTAKSLQNFPKSTKLTKSIKYNLRKIKEIKRNLLEILRNSQNLQELTETESETSENETESIKSLQNKKNLNQIKSLKLNKNNEIERNFEKFQEIPESETSGNETLEMKVRKTTTELEISEKLQEIDKENVRKAKEYNETETFKNETKQTKRGTSGTERKTKETEEDIKEFEKETNELELISTEFEQETSGIEKETSENETNDTENQINTTEEETIDSEKEYNQETNEIEPYSKKIEIKTNGIETHKLEITPTNRNRNKSKQINKNSPENLKILRKSKRFNKEIQQEMSGNETVCNKTLENNKNSSPNPLKLRTSKRFNKMQDKQNESCEIEEGTSEIEINDIQNKDNLRKFNKPRELNKNISKKSQEIRKSKRFLRNNKTETNESEMLTETSESETNTLNNSKIIGKCDNYKYNARKLRKSLRILKGSNGNEIELKGNGMELKENEMELKGNETLGINKEGLMENEIVIEMVTEIMEEKGTETDTNESERETNVNNIKQTCNEQELSDKGTETRAIKECPKEFEDLEAKTSISSNNSRSRRRSTRTTLTNVKHKLQDPKNDKGTRRSKRILIKTDSNCKNQHSRPNKSLRHPSTFVERASEQSSSESSEFTEANSLQDHLTVSKRVRRESCSEIETLESGDDYHTFAKRTKRESSPKEMLEQHSGANLKINETSATKDQENRKMREESKEKTMEPNSQTNSSKKEVKQTLVTQYFVTKTETIEAARNAQDSSSLNSYDLSNPSSPKSQNSVPLPLSPLSPKTEEEHFEFYEPKEKLNKQHISHLIQLYRQHPRLWDQSHPDFFEPQICRKSWQQITDQWNEFCKRNFTIAEVRIRISTLCQRYLQERERLTLEGELDEFAKFPYYEQMQFLEQQKSLQKRRELYEQQNEKILEIYRNFPILWHVGCYKTKQAKEKAQAFESISKSLKSFSIHLSSIGVQKRIRSLRKCYRLEKIRFLHAQVEQTPFESEFRHYERMQFLDKHIDPFVCRICGKIFENLVGFRDHLEAENHGNVLQEDSESEEEEDSQERDSFNNEFDKSFSRSAMENKDIPSSCNTPLNSSMDLENPDDILQTFTPLTSTPIDELEDFIADTPETPLMNSAVKENQEISENHSPIIQEVLIFPPMTPVESPLTNSYIEEDQLIEEIMETVTSNDSFTNQSLDQFINTATNCEIPARQLITNFTCALKSISLGNPENSEQNQDQEPTPTPESKEPEYKQNSLENSTSSNPLLVKVQCADYSLDLQLNPEHSESSNTNTNNDSDHEFYSSADISTIPLPDHHIHKMIELYRKYPQLWNPNHLDYNSRNLRRQAWCSLTAEFNKYAGKQFSWRTMHRKLTDYAKYYKKLITEQEDYEELENKWTFYEDFKFMDDVIVVHDELQRTVHHRDNNFKIIAIYETFPQLWDIKHPDYNKRCIKQRNFELMCNRLQEENNLQITTERLKNRLIELRAQYRLAKKQRLKCEKTGQTFSTDFEFYEVLKFLDDHIDPFVCECKIEFKKLTDYNQHQKKEHERKAFNRKRTLSTISLETARNVENICHICGIKFTTRSNLVHHIKRHEGIRNYECTMCKKMFYTSHQLKVHIRSHTKECPYTCEKCGNSFVSASKLNQHVKRHLDRKDFQCSYCPKAFYSGYEKDRHEKRHLNIREKVCPVCGKTFVAGSSYYAHMMLHSDTKRFECDKCEMKFAQYAGLYKHKKRHHS